MAKKKNFTEKEMQAAYEKAIQRFLHRDNITGIDIGFKYTDGKRLKTQTIRFHVAEKIPNSQLEAVALFPDEIDGVPTDVIQAIYAPQLTAVQSRRRRFDYLQPGVSVGHPNVTAGTLGAIVYDNQTGAPCMLSNWHVLAGSDDAHIGDGILQPGRIDGGRKPDDETAVLKRYILNKTGDAAIAQLNGNRPALRLQYETNVIAQSARKAKNGDILEKSGRTTGVTSGEVDGGGRYKIRYSVGVVAVDGFKIVPLDKSNPNDDEISLGGDSGSLWYDPETSEGVGLHFAGETSSVPSAEHGIACHLPDVLSALDVSLVPIQAYAHPVTNPWRQVRQTEQEHGALLPTRSEQGDMYGEVGLESVSETAVTINWNPSPHFSSRVGYRPEAIVIHIAEGPFTAIGNWFKNPASQVSAHYGVSKVGEIDQYVAEDNSAWHAGNIAHSTWSLLKAGVNPNWYTIGIEHAGFADDPWTNVMYQASANLVREIAQRHSIPLDRDHIIGHREIYGHKTCPGSQVDLAKLIALAKGSSAGGSGVVVPSNIYIVQRGDTLYGIARRFGTTIDTLKQLNLEIVSVDVIYVGQSIRLP